MPNNPIKNVYAHFTTEKSPQLTNLSHGHTELVNDKPVCEGKSAIHKALTLSIYQAPDPSQKPARWEKQCSANWGPGSRTVARGGGQAQASYHNKDKVLSTSNSLPPRGVPVAAKQNRRKKAS